jgi:hypothetical protein
MGPFDIAHSSKSIRRDVPANFSNEWLYLTSLSDIRQLRSLKELAGSLVVRKGNSNDDSTIHMTAGWRFWGLDSQRQFFLSDFLSGQLIGASGSSRSRSAVR